MGARMAVRERQGQHICVLYDSEFDMEETVIPFITAGLMMGEKCGVVAGEQRLSIFKELLNNTGVPTGDLMTQGQLVMRTDLTDCPFSASAVGSSKKDDPGNRIAASLSSCGFAGYRCVFAVTDFICHIDGRSLIDREIGLNDLLSHVPATMLLLYDRRLMSEAIMADMMEIHPRLIDRGSLYENPDYVLPDELL